MSFTELLVDCVEQGKRARFKVAPLLVAKGPIGIVRWMVPALNIPEPDYMGDLIKLFSGRKPRLDVNTLSNIGEFPGHRVEVQGVIDTSNITETFRFIEQPITRSRSTCQFRRLAICVLGRRYGHTCVGELRKEASLFAFDDAYRRQGLVEGAVEGA
jgi:hypothetical protein